MMFTRDFGRTTVALVHAGRFRAHACLELNCGVLAVEPLAQPLQNRRERQRPTPAAVAACGAMFVAFVSGVVMGLSQFRSPVRLRPSPVRSVFHPECALRSDQALRARGAAVLAASAPSAATFPRASRRPGSGTERRSLTSRNARRRQTRAGSPRTAKTSRR